MSMWIGLLIEYLRGKFDHHGFCINTRGCNSTYPYIDMYHKDHRVYPVLHITFPIYIMDLCEMSIKYKNGLYGYMKRNPCLNSMHDIYEEAMHFFYKYLILEDVLSRSYIRTNRSLEKMAYLQLSTMDIRRIRTDFFLILL